MRYEVTYKTDVKPTALPEGAVVKEVEDNLPGVVTATRDGGRTVTVSEAVSTDGAIIQFKDLTGMNGGAILTADETRELIQLLRTVIGDHIAKVGDVLRYGDAPADNVTRVTDYSGDIIVREGDQWHWDFDDSDRAQDWDDICVSWFPFTVIEVR